MGQIFCMMGKSASGKDTIFQMLMMRKELHLKKIVPYTTRPIRSGEKEGVEYHFVSVDRMQEMQNAGKIIELRTYHTHEGDWHYFTADDGQINLDVDNYLMIATPEAYLPIREYFRKNAAGSSLGISSTDQKDTVEKPDLERTVPIYIEVEDGERLQRALSRERAQKHPKYAEMCRRFLADEQDFAPEKLAECGITKVFENQNPEETADEVAGFILARES